MEQLHLEGKRFGRLVALRRASGGGLLCLCDCGNEKRVAASNLKEGRTKSCGCLNREASSARNRIDKRKHGMARTPEHKAWVSMRQRCYNENDKSFIDYGGRGIIVDDRWSTFEQFSADMGARPSPSHSLDRRNVDGNYSPENCRWATTLEQQRNKRNNLMISAFGRTASLSSFISDSHSAEYQRARKAISRGADAEKVLVQCRS